MMNLDMEYQIHYLETEAYFSVLRAFKAQSDAISWDKEGLITELRKELRVSDDEHREVLGRVNSDDSIRKIREWRQSGGNLPGHDGLSSPTISGSRKKQRTSQSVPPLSVPPAGLHPHSIPPTVQPSPSLGSQGRRSKQYSAHANGKNQYSASGAFGGHETTGLGHELIGRKAFTRWPDDNKFYEACITGYNAQDGRHHLVYDMGTANETWEWVDLRQISMEDIRWVGEDPGISHRGGHVDRRSAGPGGVAVPPPARSRHKRESQNGVARMDTDDIQILHTETLIREVEKVVAATNPDRFEIEKAKIMLKDHEQALEYAISRLSYVSDGESGNEYLHI